MAHHFTAGEASIWVQIDGPNTVPVYLGCHQVGDVDEPQGDIELIYCQDASAPNKFEVVGSVQGAAGAVTTSVTADVTDELDELEKANCPITLFVHKLKAGRRDVFTNFDRSFVFREARITSKGLSGLTSRTPDDNARSEQTFDLSAEGLMRPIEATIAQQTSGSTWSIADITFCNEQRCRTDEDVALSSCQVGFFSTDVEAASPTVSSDIFYTSNGSTWSNAGMSDPFAANEAAISIDCFELSRDTTRAIVARGTTDAAAPAEIAYSDDNGVTWTNVNVGSTNTQYAPTRFSLFAYDRNNIWFGTDDGYIYYSADAGLTWTAQESAVLNSGAWNAIEFVDTNVGWAVGASNEIARSIDGGSSWSAITGPTARSGDNIIALHVLDRNRVWIGYDSGHLYYTLDGGALGNASWTQRSFSGSGTGEVRDVTFFNDLLGYLVHNSAAPLGSVLWTIDGGYTWQAITTPTNAGLNVVWPCDQWTFYVCGEDVAAAGFIAKGAVT